MTRIFKTIGIIAIMGIMLVGAYWLGTTQAETVTAVKEVEKAVEVVPDGYIDTNSEEFYNNYVDMREVIDFNANENGLQLYFVDGTGYYLER